MNRIHQFLNDEHGFAAVEYGLIAAGSAVVVNALVSGADSWISQALQSLTKVLEHAA